MLTYSEIGNCDWQLDVDFSSECTMDLPLNSFMTGTRLQGSEAHGFYSLHKCPDRHPKKVQRSLASLVHFTYEGPASDFFMKIYTSKKL
jgi:hypothetical protein